MKLVGIIAFTLTAASLGVVAGCGETDRGQRLDDYIQQSFAGKVKYRKLIACAAGGHPGFMTPGTNPISVFFYPEAGKSARDYKMFESAGPTPADENDNTNYFEVLDAPATKPVFNGYLRRFATTFTDRNTWIRVTYAIGDAVFIADPIKLKMPERPTEHASTRISITWDGTSPVFAWTDGKLTDSVIYFQVVSTAKGDLVSGTYTKDRRWKFYDTSNVTLNIRDIKPAPTLMKGQSYTFTLMAVSDDNWVNLVGATTFTAR